MENFDLEILERLPASMWNPRTMLKGAKNGELSEEEQNFIGKITGEFGNDLWGDMFNNKIDFSVHNPENLQEAIEILRKK